MSSEDVEGSSQSSKEDERSVLECEVCLELYNESNRIPRSLSCSHTLCTSCIIQLLRRGPLKCPFCRGFHTGVVISSVDIPVREDLMSLVFTSSKEDDCDSSEIFASGATKVSEVSHVNVTRLKADVLKAQEEGTGIYAQLVGNGGEVRHAKLSTSNGRLHLHALKDGPPPEGSRIVSYERVRALVDDYYQVVFLDIAKDDVHQGKIYIKLIGDAGRTRQFLYFCTGERGPSYANTCFFEVANKGDPDEKYQRVRALADDIYRVVFFDITWDEVYHGKVYIKLFEDAGRTLQFLYLCTGERGPSYANTHFFEVSNKGRPGEHVWGGDYENDDGSGGAALPTMERGPKNHQDVTAGLIAGFYYTGYRYDNNPAQFRIYVRDMPDYNEMSTIGKVISGLEMMVSVASLADVHSACIYDCGLVLFH